MRHYFYILALTWVSIGFVLLSSWMMILLGVNTIFYTMLLPAMLASGGIAYFSCHPWFHENILVPLEHTVRYGSYVEIVIHLQLFTLICGVLGIGLGILMLTSLYPVGIETFFKNVAAGDMAWHSFQKYTSVSVLGGFFFGFLLYIYLFARARGKRHVTRTIIACGLLFFFALGMICGEEQYYIAMVSDRAGL